MHVVLAAYKLDFLSSTFVCHQFPNPSPFPLGFPSASTLQYADDKPADTHLVLAYDKQTRSHGEHARRQSFTGELGFYTPCRAKRVRLVQARELPEIPHQTHVLLRSAPDLAEHEWGAQDLFPLVFLVGCPGFCFCLVCFP